MKFEFCASNNPAFCRFPYLGFFRLLLSNSEVRITSVHPLGMIQHRMLSSTYRPTVNEAALMILSWRYVAEQSSFVHFKIHVSLGALALRRIGGKTQVWETSEERLFTPWCLIIQTKFYCLPAALRHSIGILYWFNTILPAGGVSVS